MTGLNVSVEVEWLGHAIGTRFLSGVIEKSTYEATRETYNGMVACLKDHVTHLDAQQSTDIAAGLSESLGEATLRAFGLFPQDSVLSERDVARAMDRIPAESEKRGTAADEQQPSTRHVGLETDSTTR